MSNKHSIQWLWHLPAPPARRTKRELYYVLGDDGTIVPVQDALEWAMWLEMYREKRIVQQTNLEVRGEHYFVSTIFLGMDHSFTLEGPPILFETCVFYEDRPSPDASEFLGRRINKSDVVARYSTWEEAEAGHRQVIKQLGGIP